MQISECGIIQLYRKFLFGHGFTLLDGYYLTG